MSTPTQTSVADDAEIVRRILAHIDAGTTDQGDDWREPVENYVNPIRFTAELETLRSYPSVYLPSAAIPSVGDHAERVTFGVPLFAVRDRDGRARVFRNACRHRGMALVEGPGCARALVCRYHGWTYRLDGSLSHVPHAEAFPDLNMPTRGLVEVDSREVDGLIVIGPLQSPARDADAAMAALTDGSPWRDKLLPFTRLVAVRPTLRAMNWKVLVEQFLEGYHIRSTHKDTFYPIQYDDLSVIEAFGPNTRITFPYQNIERLRDRPESAWNVSHRVTYVYHLFPNVMVATFPNQVLVVTIDPVDVDHTNVTIHAMVTPEVAEYMSANPEAADDPRSLLNAGGAEDNEMSEGVQRGLHAGANAFVEFGTHESAIGRFHAALDGRLACR
ncbi:aromatic ring-hydroxylating oxygenase subunit alpha [Mycolicibacterium moriokaense]|uniref:Phenylpropionate dioxygenase-like ring-hydroxylating dioxygenase large terminal subunit n=1 Tax=Mycolicibacterium moriokaense TaxID=39691 RepID=A0A318HEL4_9MYCO|nr:SRPBCC family protein [Mycolicibacterium moriokaense]PXX03449.1 phenylpropionate dioxygenase-like ring-hydroxylating dioxygenase large terminal subunit [Mycolicibacterium moriokaense]